MDIKNEKGHFFIFYVMTQPNLAPVNDTATLANRLHLMKGN